MPKRKDDDTIFKNAKNKVGRMLEKEEDATKVVALANALTKMKAVELKMGEDDWGSGLRGGED